MKKTGCFIGFLFAFLLAFGQKENGSAFVGYGHHYGFIQSHTYKNDILVKRHFSLGELHLMQKADGSREWHKDYHNPNIGISLIFSDLGNPEMLGFTAGLLPWMSFPSYILGRHWGNIKAGVGIAYVKKPFELGNNFKNMALSTHLNALVSFQYEYPVLISDRVVLTPGLSFFHISSGALKMPNTGINIPMVSLKAAYRVKKGSTKPPSANSANTYNHTAWWIALNYGLKQPLPPGSELLHLYGLQGEFSFQYNRLSALLCGADLFIGKNTETYSPEVMDSIPITSAGVYIGNAFRIGRLSPYMHWGFYVYRSLRRLPFYHRVGINYQITKKWVVSATIKSHFGDADHIEWSIRYRIQ